MRSNQGRNWRRCLFSLRPRIYNGTAEGESGFSRAHVTIESYGTVCTFSIGSAFSSTAAINGDAFYFLVIWFLWYIRSETCPKIYRVQVLRRCTPEKSEKQFPRARPQNCHLRKNRCDPEESIKADFQIINHFTASAKLNVFIVIFAQCLFRFFQRFCSLPLF